MKIKRGRSKELDEAGKRRGIGGSREMKRDWVKQGREEGLDEAEK